MPRNLSTATVTAVTANDTQPVWLIELCFSVVLRYSTAGEQTWNGYTWFGIGAQVETVNNARAQATRARVSLPNDDLSIGALVLSEQTQGIPAALWRADRTALATADPEKIFEGVIDAYDVGLRVNFELIADAARAQFVPRRPFGPPLCNFLPAPGTVLDWSGVSLELSAS